MYKLIVKPFFDFLAAAAILLLASPLLLFTILALSMANRGRIWFLQDRPGLNGSIFRVIKFKTMNDRKNAQGELLPDVERITAIGRAVRASSIDELPQLINVLKGDMSLVGPRPLLVEYLPLYSAIQNRRHEVKPGITGWAQVQGRNQVPWATRFDMDVWYVDHQSFWVDLKILLLTVIKVFKREGISSSTSVTMEKFRGN